MYACVDADSVRFVTGHARSECTASVEERYHWAALADEKTTLVIYMGLSTLPELTATPAKALTSSEAKVAAAWAGVLKLSTSSFDAASNFL